MPVQVCQQVSEEGLEVASGAGGEPTEDVTSPRLLTKKLRNGGGQGTEGTGHLQERQSKQVHGECRAKGTGERSAGSRGADVYRGTTSESELLVS